MGEVLGRDLDAQVVSRRPGDPAATFASIERISQEFGWVAQRDLREMAASAWTAWQAHPAGS
jgi:UDP-glucose 4-epimerase